MQPGLIQRCWEAFPELVFIETLSSIQIPSKNMVYWLFELMLQSTSPTQTTFGKGKAYEHIYSFPLIIMVGY